MSLGEFIQSQLQKKLPSIKSDEVILEVFRVRLTKKERKLVKFLHENLSEADMKAELLYDNETLEKAKKSLIKKLNQSKLKHELTDNISN